MNYKVREVLKNTAGSELREALDWRILFFYGKRMQTKICMGRHTGQSPGDPNWELPFELSQCGYVAAPDAQCSCVAALVVCFRPGKPTGDLECRISLGPSCRHS